MTPNIKKVIAREGLVTIGIIVFSVLIILVGNIAIFYEGHIRLNVPKGYVLVNPITDENAPIGFGIKNIGYLCLISGYPTYLLIRFIIWSIRTLRAK